MKPKGIVLRYEPQADGNQPQQVNPIEPLLRDRKTKISSREDDLNDEDKNLMPSMVVRQQRNQNKAINHESESQIKTKTSSTATTSQVFKEAKNKAALGQLVGTQRQHSFDQDGLILPRRVLPHHSALGYNEQPTTMRDLNRELKFNQVQGKNVLDQKSELKKALEKLDANRRRKEAEQERLTRRTSLELRLEERAQRLASKEESPGEGKQASNILSN